MFVKKLLKQKIGIRTYASKSSMLYKQEELLEKQHIEGRYRTFFDIERIRGKYPLAYNHTKIKNVEDIKIDNKDSSDSNSNIVVWCNNDYQNMGQNTKVQEEFINATKKCGVGSGGTRNISGTTPYHSKQEETLSKVNDKESLIFSSCYVANTTSLHKLGQLLKDCVFFSDAQNHASLIEGIVNSRCEKYIFEHNNVEHLRKQLSNPLQKERPKIIVFESVYSMDGDIAPIKDICDLADEYQAFTYLDEVHAVGIYGDKGGGIAQKQNQNNRIDIVSGTLGKGYGVYGGYISSNKIIIDILRSYCPGFIFTTSIPPAIAAAATVSIDLLSKDNILRQKQQESVSKVKNKLYHSNIPIIVTPTHIIPVLIGNANLCKKVSDALLYYHNIYVQPINYPTVPYGTERLRITPTPLHDDALIDNFIYAINDVWNTLKIPRTHPLATPYDSSLDIIPIDGTQTHGYVKKVVL